MSELYRLKDIHSDDVGLPFTMCMNHIRAYPLPLNCLLQKLGESGAPCFMCENERQQLPTANREKVNQ